MSARHPGLPRLQRIAADTLFALLLLTILLLAGWHTARREHYWDWTSSARNSLSSESIALLGRLTEPLHITVYAPAGHRVSRAVEQLLARYRQQRPDLLVDYVDPQRFPERARDADVRLLGQLVVDYQGRRERLSVLSESALTNAIARLTTAEKPWVAVLEGHGERAISGGSGADLGRFAQLLRQRGFRLLTLDLARAPAIPTNVDLLLLSMPSIALFPGEAESLLNYIDAGSNLLWLMDPTPGADNLLGLAPLAERLGVRPLPGQIVDAAAAEQGLDSPTFAIVDRWPEHPLAQGLTRAAIFPGSLAFDASGAPGWRLATTLATGELSWNETGPVRGEIARDDSAGEAPGPLALALALTRPLSETATPRSAPGPDLQSGPQMAQGQQPANEPIPKPELQQRVIVVGDGDFLSNAHLGNGINQAVALRMAHWLTGGEDLVTVPNPVSDTDALQLAPVRGWAIFGGGLIALPVLLAALGIAIRWQRGRA